MYACFDIFFVIFCLFQSQTPLVTMSKGNQINTHFTPRNYRLYQYGWNVHVLTPTSLFRIGLKIIFIPTTLYLFILINLIITELLKIKLKQSAASALTRIPLYNFLARTTYVQKCMQWRNWRKIASLQRFELDAKSGPLETGNFGENFCLHFGD